MLRTTWTHLRLYNSLFPRFIHNSVAARNSEASAASSAEKVTLTDSCVRRLKEITAAENSKFLRISVEGGGCSGFQYNISLDTKMATDDCLFERDGAKVVIDKLSLEYLEGATIDFQSELIRSAFRVLKNPKAEKGCSCGSSFSLKI